MALEQKLENLDGNLRDAYKQAVPGTVLCVDQLMKERITNPELRDLWFYTADGEVYSMDNGTPTLRITRETVNPVLKNIDAASEQLVNHRNYLVPSAEFAAVKSASDTVVIDLTKLRLQGKENEWCYLAVNTSTTITDYNPEEQKLLGRVFGASSDYALIMEMLRQSLQRIQETKIFVLNPDYVKTEAKNEPVGRASWLVNFLNGCSYFDADNRGINSLSRVRGVRREVIAEGDASKNKVPSAPLEIKLATFDEVKEYSAGFVPDVVLKQFEAGLRKLYKP